MKSKTKRVSANRIYYPYKTQPQPMKNWVKMNLYNSLFISHHLYSFIMSVSLFMS